MRVFKNTWFSKFARKEKISDGELKKIVKQLEEGQAEADLGGGVYKVRQACPGKGKSGGHRVIVLFKSKFRTFFVYAFSKSDRSNISEDELRIFKDRAKDVFSSTEEQINARVKKGTFIEILIGDTHEKIQKRNL